MANFAVKLGNSWTLRARVQQRASVVPNGSARVKPVTTLEFSIWDDETKSGVTIEAADAQVLLGMHALDATQLSAVASHNANGSTVAGEGLSDEATR